VTVYANELSDGKSHDFKDLPWLIVGGAGYFAQGEHIKLVENSTTRDQTAPHNKLLTMFMNAVGVPTDNFGGNKAIAGEFDELKA
jgi:hypothetical protein